jgi:hypothetical protein
MPLQAFFTRSTYDTPCFSGLNTVSHTEISLRYDGDEISKGVAYDMIQADISIKNKN